MCLTFIVQLLQGESGQGLEFARYFNFFYFCLSEFEYLLGKVGAVDTKITDDPKPKIKDKMFADLGSNDW